MSVETIISTPDVAIHHKYRVSEFSVMDIQDPDNLKMPADTDGIPLNGITLRTGINQSFPTKINHKVTAPVNDMFGFVDAFKRKDMKKCKTHLNGIIKGVRLEKNRTTKISPLCASERGTEYAFFSIPKVFRRIEKQTGKKVVFLNPSRGSVERASRFGLKFDVIMTVKDEERRTIIRDICHEKGWKVYSSDINALKNKYAYYVSFHPQIAIETGLKTFFGFRPNAGKTVFFRKDVNGVKRSEVGYDITYDKVDYAEDYSYHFEEDFNVVTCDILNDYFSMVAKRRRIGASSSPGYDTNIMLYHDMLLSFESPFNIPAPEPISGVCIPLHVKYLVASDIEVTDGVIYGNVGDGRVVLDNLSEFPRGLSMDNKVSYKYSSDWTDVVDSAAFMRMPFSGHPIFLGFKYKYYNDKIYDIFFNKGEVVRLDPSGSIVVTTNGIDTNYEKVSSLSLPCVDLLSWYKSSNIAYSEYDDVINRYDVSYGVDFMSRW